ncbi:MAG TPA: amidohydrolase family protein [Candidatus Binataceae bacterium]|jgi:predicted TIM-barrel fold metal-dependent hydrolase|nr:amidohydrolase family protein [Candidatus Binataceae bacterium]
MAVERIVSADSHVVEPADVWTARMEPRFADRAPHVVQNHGKLEGDFFVCENLPPTSVKGFALAGHDPKEYFKASKAGYAGVPPGAWDPTERIKDQERDGVAAEVLYPSLAMALFQLQDGELRTASFRAYNDWLADYVSQNTKRLAGVALIPLDDPQLGAAELERVARKGLKGGMIWAEPPGERPYHDRVYDIFWAAAQDHAMPLSLHILTERKRDAPARDFLINYPTLQHATQRSLSGFIMGGVLERFPRLKLVSVENDVGWIGHFIQRMDHAYQRFGITSKNIIPNPPSFYFHRQVNATFQDDRVGVVTRQFAGVENLMWASDFPHADSTWPNSREVIARDFQDVPAAERQRMVADNAAELYGIG